MSKEIEEIVKNLTEASYSGSIKSIAVVFIDSSDDFKMMYHVPANVLLATLGSVQVLAGNIVSTGLKQVPPKDYLS